MVTELKFLNNNSEEALCIIHDALSRLPQFLLNRLGNSFLKQIVRGIVVKGSSNTVT